MRATAALARGREAFGREAWLDAYTCLALADRQTPLDPDDLDRLATAAYLVGEDAASIDARTRAHNGFLAREEPIRAARSAFWLAFTILDKQRAQAGGWLARAARLLDEATGECVEQGLLLCASAFQKVGADQIDAAHAEFARAASLGGRFHDPDLTALARHGEGRALLRLGRAAEGFAMLDEVMVAVTCGEVGPLVSGVVYCSVIGACHDLCDLRRAQEWTAALTGWCDAHPELVPFRGPCLVRRSELMQLHGDWPGALDEARRACDRLTDRPEHPDAAAAYGQLAEVHRLRGDFQKADDFYRRASHAAPRPHPGLARLRLAQGQGDAAAKAILRAVEETRQLGVHARADVLAACVDILLDRQTLPPARDAAAELARMAGEIAAPFLQATSAQAAGAVALADGDERTAVGLLRSACEIWRELDAPYQVARTRVLLGLACRRLGDEEGARMELEAAQDTFDRLGAAPDAARTAALLAPEAAPAAGGLTGREVEVLRLVASGRTNRAIAAELSISEKTVARHLANIFTKLDLSSRSAATAYAYEHRLI